MAATSFAPGWIATLISQILARVHQAPDGHTALALAEWLATFLWKNNTGIYRLDELETSLLPHCLHTLPDLAPCPASDTELHVATEVYAFGGHTSLMRQLVHAGGAHCRVILTRMRDPKLAATRLDLPVDRVHVLEPSAAKWQRVGLLAQAMSQHKQVVLHIHPNDIVAALAVRLLKLHSPQTRVLLVNHADHAFSVGVGAADRILEISRYGWSLRARRGSETRSTYLGIPIPRPDTIAPHEEPNKQVKILSGGSAYKFKPAQGMSLPSTLGKLLRRHPHFCVTVIGPSPRDWWWWPLRLTQPARVKLMALMSKEAYMTELRSSTIYVDSHPLLGGTAFPEALMRGCRVAGMRGLAWGYSPADELCSEDEASFMQQCAALAAGDPAALERQQQVRARCIEEHAPAAVRERLEHAMASDTLLPPPKSVVPDPTSVPMEKEWMRTGCVSLPSRRECPLPRADRLWLARLFASASGGLLRRSTWTLLRLALTTHR